MVKTAAAKTTTPVAKKASPAKKAPVAKKAPAAKKAPVAKKTAPAKKAVVAKPVEKKIAPVVTPPAAALKPAAAPAAKSKPVSAEPKAKKPKLVRDSFTMPEAEYQVLGDVKKACLKAGVATKKSELLRVGVALIRTMDTAQLKAAIAALAPVKAGRPKKEK